MNKDCHQAINGQVIIKCITGLVLFMPTLAIGAQVYGTGIPELILGVVIVLCFLWVMFSIAVSVVVTKSIIVRVILSTIISIAPIAYIESRWDANDKREESRRVELKERNERIARESIPYFQQRCRVDRVKRLLKPIDWSAGLFVDSDYSQKLQIHDIPVPPETPETARKEFYAKYPDGYEKQFISPIYWVSQFDESNIFPGARFSFVEDGRTAHRNIRARAGIEWWLEVGRYNLIEEDKARLAQIIKNTSNIPNHSISLPVISSRARYILSVKDISTREDRLHWTARGKITLTDKEANEVIAEYVGFVRQEYPTSEYKFLSSHWEPAVPCDGEEQDFLSGQRWNVVQFFFERVIAGKGNPASDRGMAD